MKNKTYKYDFLIVGAGLIGALAGLELLKKKFKVLIIEKNNQSLSDRRTLAVNANSRYFLKSLELWDKLANEPLNKIIIEDHINHSPLEFENLNEPMGSVIYNKELLLKARSYLKKKKVLFENIDFDINNIDTLQTIKLKNKYYEFSKIVLSVGKITAINPNFKQRIYNSHHKSYVGFFNHSLNHENKAYEFFTQFGPLAVLPAPNKTKNLSTFIYSSKIFIEQNKLKKLIKKFFNKTHGQISFINEIKSFKIFPHLSVPIKKNIILIGDSLRSIHPVAGQGWNLGIKDIQTLSDLLNLYDINDDTFVDLYFSKRKIESYAYLSFTNLINYLYENDNKINRSIINFGFQSLLKLNPLRRTFIKQAMGKFSLI